MNGCSYREVIPTNSFTDEWIEIKLNTGGTQSTLQDITVAEKAGGYAYQKISTKYNQNRFIHWRSFQDILELTETSLDYNLSQNNLRYKFTDSPVLSVLIKEHGNDVVLLVSTVCSLHCITFAHPDTMFLGMASTTSKTLKAQNTTMNCSLMGNNSMENNVLQSLSIFANATNSIGEEMHSKGSFVIDTQIGTSNMSVPHAASNFLSDDGEIAYFGMACKSHLMLYVMNCKTYQTITIQLKEQHKMPRILSNLKGVLTGKNDSSDDEYANSLVFTYINNKVYLLVLYRNNFLRVWTTSGNGNLVYTVNCVSENRQQMQGPQSNILRAITEHSFCAFLSHASCSEFVNITIRDKSDSNGCGFDIDCRKIINAPPLDLTDFEVCKSRIWALWSNAEGESSISSFPLSHGKALNWIPAAMEPPPYRCYFGSESASDPREAYCSYIFQPGKFTKSVIAKALYMFCRSNSRFDEQHCNMNSLRDHVCQSVEDELQNEINTFDVSGDEYIEICTRLWERFYTACEQYHMKASQPIGLLVLEKLNAVCIIKKTTFSMLRPCEELEHFMLVSETEGINNMDQFQFTDNEELNYDVICFVGLLAKLEKWLPDDIKIDYDRKLYQLEHPNVLIEKIVNQWFLKSECHRHLPKDMSTIIQRHLHRIKDINKIVSILLSVLHIKNVVEDDDENENADTIRELSATMSIGNLFGSQIGISMLSETVRQVTLIRYALCRSLLLLNEIVNTLQLLPVNVMEKLRSQLMPNVVDCLLSYYVMVWIAETPINVSNMSHTFQTSIQKLNVPRLNIMNWLHHQQFNQNQVPAIANQDQWNTATLLKMFLNSRGLSISLARFIRRNNIVFDKYNWQNTLMPLVSFISQQIWSITSDFNFGEWLLSTCQHVLIADYIRLLNNWCESNLYSRQFILAVSLLDCGEVAKAYDLFLQAAKGVVEEQFLAEKILGDTNLLNENGVLSSGPNVKNLEIKREMFCTMNQCMAEYFLRVIQLFEQHNALNHIIAISQVAIGLLDKQNIENSQLLPMFQSIVFNNHLQLEHYEKAYHSLIYNADATRRKDCLRQLVITLFNRKRLDLLANFPYIGLEAEFENIVESRARTQSIENNEVYNFLYAYHLNNGNMRKASSILYEQAMRLQIESDSVESLHKRLDSLVMCLNSLLLIDERYRWIAKPAFIDDFEQQPQPNKNSIAKPQLNQPNQVVVVEVDHIRRELLLTEALIYLTNHRVDIQSISQTGVNEIVSILCNCSYFTFALKVCQHFGISKTPVFDSLTTACVYTAEQDTTASWSWLQENDLSDLPQHNDASYMAWSLLQKLVLDNENTDACTIKQTVVRKLLNLNAFIPQWLLNEYKLSNCCELLHQFVKYNRLLEATELAQEMLSAMLGAGSSYFSFKHPITVRTAEQLLPVNILDILLECLKANSEIVEYKQAASELEMAIKRYMEIATRTAEDKIKMNIL